jgi:hypothetical protein
MSDAIVAELRKNELKLEMKISISDLKLRKAIYEAFEGRCFYTGQPVPFEKMCIDHVVPKSKGGENNIYNYVLTSQRLNAQKSAKLYRRHVEPVLYIIKTVYAPKVMKIYHKLTKRKVFYIDFRRRDPNRLRNAVQLDIFNYVREWGEANRDGYDLAGAFGQFWYAFRKEHSIFDNVMYPKIYRKDYDPKIDYRKMHLSGEIRRLNN